MLCLGTLMIVLDVDDRECRAAVDQDDLGFSQSSLAWVVNAYLLTFGGFLLLGGRLGDLFGHRRLFLIGIALFTLASLACGLATSQGLLIAARAVQGVGGAVASAVSFALAMTLFTEPAERAKAMGIFGFVASGGGRIGVLLGGVLTDTLNWHWIFLVNVPIGVARLRALASAAARGAGLRSQPAGSTSPARVTVTAALMLAVYAIVNGNQAGWASAQTLGLLAAAVVLLARLPRDRESRVELAADAAPALPAPQPRDGERRRRALGGGDVRLVLHVGALPAARARLQPAPGRPRVPAGEPDHGRALDRDLGEARHALRLSGGRSPPGCCSPPSGLRCSRARPVDGHFLVDVLPSMILLGFGAGIAFNPVLLAAMSDVEPQEAGLASGIVNTSFMMGGALGLAVLASIAASRTSSLRAPGQPAAALDGGYHAAFLVGAVFAVAAAVDRRPAPA